MSLSHPACGHWLRPPRTPTHGVPRTHAGSLDLCAQVPKDRMASSCKPAPGQTAQLPAEAPHPEAWVLAGAKPGKTPAQQARQRAPRHLRGLNLTSVQHPDFGLWEPPGQQGPRARWSPEPTPVLFPRRFLGPGIQACFHTSRFS